jgi:hypothetical protein
MGSRILSALSGNNSVKKLTIARHTSDIGEEDMRSLAQSLSGNIGIDSATPLQSDLAISSGQKRKAP